MEIERIESFRLDGQTFRDLAKVKQYVENEIGKILDKTPLPLNPKDKLAIFEAITAKENRKRLANLLQVEIESQEWDGKNQNILDL